MTWILTNDGDLINLDRVSVIYQCAKQIKFEFFVGEDGENEYETFESEKASAKRFKEYTNMLLDSQKHTVKPL